MPPARLKIETVPLDSVRPLERNARRGDVDAIGESLRRFGQYKPLVVRAETDEVLVGNHTLQALREEGFDKIAIIGRSVPDDQEATRSAVRLSASARRGYDDPLLLDLLKGLPDLDATGYGNADLNALTARLAERSAPEDFGAIDPDGLQTDYECPQCGYGWSGLAKRGAGAGVAAGAEDDDGA